MTREQKVTKAKELRGKGRSWAELGAALGMSRSGARALLHPRAPLAPRCCFVCGSTFAPTHGNQKTCCGENARKRWHDEHARTRCADCGTDCSAGSAWRGVTRCGDCHTATLKREKAARDDLIVSLWNQGLPLAEIAARLDTTVNSIGTTVNELRHRGRHVPYRHRGYDRFPEQVAA